MKPILSCLLLIFFSLPALSAQRPDPNPEPDFEYGSVSDLRGVTNQQPLHWENNAANPSILRDEAEVGSHDPCHSTLRTPHSALRTPHSGLRTPHS